MKKTNIGRSVKEELNRVRPFLSSVNSTVRGEVLEEVSGKEIQEEGSDGFMQDKRDGVNLEVQESVRPATSPTSLITTS